MIKAISMIVRIRDEIRVSFRRMVLSVHGRAGKRHHILKTGKEGNTGRLQKEKEGTGGTIFDDVFRTMAQKMPYLLIPLVNEVFKTDHSEEQGFEQLRNEHYEKFGKVVTDSVIRIGSHAYHIECQSEKDGSMALRMMEYDFAIALEHPSRSEDGMIEINFPESCVLYVRNHNSIGGFS